MRKLIDDDGNGVSRGLGMDLDLLLNTARNVPKNPSFLKRDLVGFFRIAENRVKKRTHSFES